jgi:DNA-binding XRE family transcriptional regulator
MVTGVQIRAARSALQWSADTLAMHAGVAAKTVRRLEGEHGVPKTTTATLTKIQTALEAAGIEFIGTPDDGPGIRVRPAR